jgi:cytochrome c biogenesis protein CcdA
MVVVAIPLAFVAGLITAISPCVLPVLPIVFGSGIGENKRRPYAIIAGLATFFLLSILFAAFQTTSSGTSRSRSCSCSPRRC